MRKKLYIVLLSIIAIELPIKANPNPYEDVFDMSIYDQKRLKKSYGDEKWMDIAALNDQEIRKDILTVLIERKIDCLERKLFQKFNKELHDLQQYIEKAKPSTIGKIIEATGKFLSAGTSILLFGAENPVAVGVGIVGGGLSAIHGLLDTSTQQLDFERMRDTLNNKKVGILNNIVQENISDLEFEYVLRKRFYPVGLQTKIERTLIGARNPGLFPPISSVKEFLENCLNFPIQKKIIPDKLYFSKLDKCSDKATPAKKELCSYDKATKGQFEDMILQLIASSNSNAPSAKRAFYFYGEPGVGKSTAAEAIANHLDLPFFTTSITSSQDISTSALLGQGYTSQNSNLGTIAQALLIGRNEGNQEDEITQFKILNPRASKYQLNPEFTFSVKTKRAREAYKNTIIILNDFDRLLIDPMTATQTLSVLLEYLEVRKKTFFSYYFDQYLPMGDLIFIITANNEVPKAKTGRNPYQLSNVALLELMQAAIAGNQSKEEKEKEEQTENKAAFHYRERAKLILKGNGHQNQEKAKKDARIHLEKAKELGDQESILLLEELNFFDQHPFSPTGHKETVKTASDPYKALRDRVIEIECKGLDKIAKEEALDEFLNNLLVKYSLQIDDNTRDEIIKKIENVVSIRNAQVIFEDEVKKLKKMKEADLQNDDEENNFTILHSHSDVGEKAQKPSDASLSQHNHNPFEEQLKGLIKKHREKLGEESLPSLEMDPALQKKVGALHEISLELNFFSLFDEQQQMDALDTLLGKDNFQRLCGFQFPTIAKLWETNRLWSKDLIPLEEALSSCAFPRKWLEENSNTLGALETRMRRFESPQKKSQVFIYHLELVRAIATHFLKFEKYEQLYMEIMKDEVKKDYLHCFCNHLWLLKNKAKELISINEKSRYYKYCVKAYNDFVAWYKRKDNITCGAVIKFYYQLNLGED